MFGSRVFAAHLLRVVVPERTQKRGEGGRVNVGRVDGPVRVRHGCDGSAGKNRLQVLGVEIAALLEGNILYLLLGLVFENYLQTDEKLRETFLEAVPVVFGLLGGRKTLVGGKEERGHREGGKVRISAVRNYILDLFERWVRFVNGVGHNEFLSIVGAHEDGPVGGW